MTNDMLDKLYKDPRLLEYLRRHPKWYYFLDQDPKNYSVFEKAAKKNLKITTYDQLEKLKKQISFASAFVDYISK